MARIRTIKPSFWEDEKVARLSRDARLLMIGLISAADDQGRFVASPAAILGYIYPHDEISPAQLRRWMAEVGRELVTFYEVNGLHYGCHLNWAKHQRISHPQASALPAPQDVLL